MLISNQSLIQPKLIPRFLPLYPPETGNVVDTEIPSRVYPIDEMLNSLDGPVGPPTVFNFFCFLSQMR